MAYYPVDGVQLYAVDNLINWTLQGTSFSVGGSFVTTSGVPSAQLLPSTNTTIGYYNGNMLAYAAGGGSGIYAGLTVGAIVNWDPNSSDTGQAIWNGMIIADPSLTQPFAINTTYAGTINVATAHQHWKIIQHFCYGGGTPSTDATAVQTALTAKSIISVPASINNTTQLVFAY